MYGRIELYQPGKYNFQILTLQENWVRQGEERFTSGLELWYGRYMNLPCVENMTMQVISGQLNREGKEVIENGWFSVKIGSASYARVYPDTILNLGSKFTHTKEDIKFRLLIPGGASTKGYFLLRVVFDVQVLQAYGSFGYGENIYLSGKGQLKFRDNVVLYRAHVFDDEEWSKLTEAPSSPLYRGEDKKW